MASITLDAVLEHIHRLPLDDQIRLTNILHREQNQRVINALDDWMNDESGYDEATWPALAAALDHERDQRDMRKLFDA